MLYIASGELEAFAKLLVEAVIKYLGTALRFVWGLVWRFALCPLRKLVFPITDARSGIKQSRMRYYRVEFVFPNGEKTLTYQEVDSNGAVVGYFKDNGTR